MGDNALRSDYRPVADSYTWQNSGIDTNPYFILYHDRSTVSSTAILGIHVMVDGDKVTLRTDEDPVADRNLTASEEGAALLDETVFAYSYGFAVVYIERGKYRSAFGERLAKNLPHQFMYAFLIADAYGRKFLSSFHT